MAGRVHREIDTTKGPVLVEGPLAPETLEELSMDAGLSSFRPPGRQKEALVSIARLAEGRVYVARCGQTIVGYLTFHPPDEFDRWAGMPGILEAGAIEVSTAWRRERVGTALLETVFSDEELEDYIVISAEFCWHWDLEGAGLDVWQYRELLRKIIGRVGLEERRTDEPNIRAHPANMLMVRIGSRVSQEQRLTFEVSLFQEGWLR